MAYSPLNLNTKKLKSVFMTTTFLVGLCMSSNQVSAELLTSNAEVAAGASGNELTFVDDNPTNATFDNATETLLTSGATNITFTGDTDTVITVDSDGALSVTNNLSSDLTAAGAGNQAVIDVTSGGPNTVITIGAGTVVSSTGTSTDDADATHNAFIVRDTAQADLVNDGTLSSATSSAIYLGAGTNADITNNATGIISSAATSAAITIEAADLASPAGTIVNSGAINGGTAGVEFLLNGNPLSDNYTYTGSLTNNAGGTISGSAGPALLVETGVTITGDVVNAGTFTNGTTNGAVSLIQGQISGNYNFGAAENTTASTHIVTGDILGTTTLSTTQSDTIVLSGTARLSDITGDAGQTHTIVVRDLTAAENNGSAVAAGTSVIGNDDAGDNNSTISNISLIDLDQGTLTIDIDVTSFQADVIDIAAGTVLDNNTFSGLDVNTVNLAGGLSDETTFTGDTTINVVSGAQSNATISASGANDVFNVDLTTGTTFSLGGDLRFFEQVNINSGTLDTSIGRIEFAETVNLAQGATLDVSSANAYDATTTNVNGTWIVSNTSRVDGTVNLNSTGVISGIFRMDGQAGTQILNLNGGRIIDTFDMDGSGNDIVNVNGTFTTESTFSNVDDIIVQNGGVFTFTVDHDGNQDLVDLSANSGGRMVIDADVDITTSLGDINNNGRFDIQNTHTLRASNMTGTPEQYRFQVESGGDAGNYGRIVLGSGAATLDGSIVYIDVLGASLADGDEMALIDGADLAGAATITNATSVTDNSFLYSFELVDGSASTDANLTGVNNTDVLLRATALTLNTAAGTAPNADKNTSTIARFIDRTDFSINNTFQSYENSLATASTQAQLTTLINLASPTMDGGDIYSMVDVADQTIDNSLARLDVLRTGEYYSGFTGMAAGGRMTNYGKIWGQFFGTVLEQEARDRLPGYESISYGFTMGIDSGQSFDNGVWGVSASYANTSVDTENENNTERQIDTLQMNLYGEYYLNENVYVDGLVGIGLNTVDQTRYNVGGTGNINTATYDSYQYTARAGLGFAFDNGNWDIQPKFYTRYTGLDTESYEESGTLALNINPEFHQILDLGMKMELAYNHEYRYGSVLKPRVHAGFEYDVIGNPIEAEVGFVGAPGAFDTLGSDPSKFNYYGGAGLTYFTVEGWDFSADYIGSFRKDQSAHSGVLKLTYNF